MRNALHIVLAGLLCITATASAQEASAGEDIGIEHAKLATADASPVDPGEIEITLGYSFARATRAWDNSGDSVRRPRYDEHAASVALTFGVVENVDVSLGADYFWIHDRDFPGDTRHDDIGDFSLGVRYRFFQSEAQRIETAVISGVTVPTGSRARASRPGTSQDYWSWDSAVVMSKDWHRWTANADVGYSLPFGKRRDDARGTLSANVAAGYQVCEWLQPVLELNYARDFLRSAGDAQTLSATGGLVIPFAEQWRFDIGVQQGIWGRNADKATTFFMAVTHVR